MEGIQTSSIRRDTTPTQVTAALGENVSVMSHAPNQTETSDTADTPRPRSNPALYSLTSHPPVKVTPPNKNPEDATIDTSQVTEATKETMEPRLAVGAQTYITGEPKNTPEQETNKENTAAHENTGAPQNLPNMTSTRCENITTTQITLDHTPGSSVPHTPAATPVEVAPPLGIRDADAPIEATPPLDKQNAAAPVDTALPFNNQNSAAPTSTSISTRHGLPPPPPPPPGAGNRRPKGSYPNARKALF